MGSINIVDAMPLFTKKVVAMVSDWKKPTSFLRSFFTEDESYTKTISIQVQRGLDKIAVDVVRGTDGNRNTFGKTTEKIFEPPYFREWFDLTELEAYDALYANPEVSAIVFERFVREAADKMSLLQDKIDRSYELQAAQVFQTGIVLLNAGTNINFKRQALSMVDLGAGNYWDGGSVDPNTSIQTGCEWIRTKGKAEGNVFNMILGDSALIKFMNNTEVQSRAALFNYSMDNLVPAQRSSTGAVFHGQLSVGAYRVNVWSYPETYLDASGNDVRYIGTNKMILLPERTKNVLSYAAVPQRTLSTGVQPVKGKFLISRYEDKRGDKEIMDVKSAGVAIPTLVDQMYTAQVLA